MTDIYIKINKFLRNLYILDRAKKCRTLNKMLSDKDTAINTSDNNEIIQICNNNFIKKFKLFLFIHNELVIKIISTQ